MPIGNLKDKLDGNEIDLSLCNLTSVPVEELAKIPEATHLDLSCNLFDSLPDSFCTLTHLVKIDLSKNKLTSLPEDFGKLVNLEHLDLLGNELTTLPPSFRHLRSLTWLDLKGNPLDPKLQEQAGDCGDGTKCQACASNVLAYMEKIGQEMERKDRSGEKGSGSLLLSWLAKLPAIVMVALTLAGLTMIYGAGSIKDRLCDGAAGPACVQARDVALRTVGVIRHLWHHISNIFP